MSMRDILLSAGGTTDDAYHNVVVTFNFKTVYLINIENPSAPVIITPIPLTYEVTGVRVDKKRKLLFIYFKDASQLRYYTYNIADLSNIADFSNVALLSTQSFSPSISCTAMINDVVLDEANKLMFLAVSNSYIYKVTYNETGVRQAQTSRSVSYNPTSLVYSNSRAMLFATSDGSRFVSLNIVLTIQQTLYDTVKLNNVRASSMISDTKIAVAGYKYNEIDTTAINNMLVVKSSPDLLTSYSLQVDTDGGYFITNSNDGQIVSYSSLMAALHTYNEADTDPIKFTYLDKQRKLLICDERSTSTANRYIGIYDVSNKSSIQRLALFNYASESSIDFSMRLATFAYKF